MVLPIDVFSALAQIEDPLTPQWLKAKVAKYVKWLKIAHLWVHLVQDLAFFYCDTNIQLLILIKPNYH